MNVLGLFTFLKKKEKKKKRKTKANKLP